MQTLFFRLLNHQDKAAALGDAISAVRKGHAAHSMVDAAAHCLEAMSEEGTS
jgi:hypothetical protein